ncbi:LysR family transcriptional regulator [Pseudomonas gingeri]|nr:LysR family transcriptional regulator [Pseudomonas gingeri]
MSQHLNSRRCLSLKCGRHSQVFADCLSVTQPAVSGSLVRLRQYFGDPLFVRSGHGMKPTAKACDIAAQLLPAMAQIELLLAHNRDRKA